MNCDFEINVAELDGRLQGLLSLSGTDNRYAGGAFLLQQGEKILSIDKLIVEKYFPRAKIIIDSIKDITSGSEGLGDLEREIASNIVNDILGVSNSIFDDNVIAARKSYISFYMMDLIDLIIEAKLGKSYSVKVTKLCVMFGNGETLGVFFCISISDFFLVLQFNKPV